LKVFRFIENGTGRHTAGSMRQDVELGAFAEDLLEAIEGADGETRIPIAITNIADRTANITRSPHNSNQRAQGR
jgi:hypothetical protein